MARNVYLQVEFKTGNLFEFSKEEKDGFEDHKNTKGTVSWRRYQKEGVYGIYRGTSIRETNFGKELSIHVVTLEGDNCYISLPLFTQDKSIAPYAESFIAVMESVEKDFVYRFFPYAMEREGTTYKNYGVSVAHADMKEETVRGDYPLKRLSYTHKKDGKLIKGDIPETIWEKAVDGSNTKNTKDKDMYLYKILEDNATGSQKMSNKVSGGAPPQKYTTDGMASTPEEKPAPAPQKVELSTPEEAPAPAPQKFKAAEAPAPASNENVDLPF